MFVQVKTFTPLQNVETANITVTSGSQNIAMTGSDTGNVRVVRLANVGSQTVYVKFGDSSITVNSTNGIPLLSNSVETFGLGKGWTHVAAIAATTGSILYLTLGEGS